MTSDERRSEGIALRLLVGDIGGEHGCHIRVCGTELRSAELDVALVQLVDTRKSQASVRDLGDHFAPGLPEKTMPHGERQVLPVLAAGVVDHDESTGLRCHVRQAESIRP